MTEIFVEKKTRKTKGSFRQHKAVEIAKGLIATNQPVVMKDIMLKAGYPSASAHNAGRILTNSKTWRDAFRDINWGLQLQQVEDLADTRLNTDKDNALKAKHMLFTLGDKFPKSETKIVGIFNKIDNLQEDDLTKNIPN